MVGTLIDSITFIQYHTYSHHNETLYSKKLNYIFNSKNKKNLIVSPTANCNYRQPPATTTFTTVTFDKPNKIHHRVKKKKHISFCDLNQIHEL